MNNKLELKTIRELLGEDFIIPSYQRGYRWTERQVNDLLNDIWSYVKPPIEGKFYCLQPVVVKKKTWEKNGALINGWELIDGQQRLTTIRIILEYLMRYVLKEDSLEMDYGKRVYSINYETRDESEQFLCDIVDNHEDDSEIDFYHMSNAYKTIEEWFSSNLYAKDRRDKQKVLDTILGKVEDESSVRVIWYEIDDNEDGKTLFAKYNMGRIPLTNAELIKALILSESTSSDSPIDKSKRIEIALVWDIIEQSLHEDSFWGFITNRRSSDYQNRIELLFDLIAEKDAGEHDDLKTFLYFQNEYQKLSDSDTNSMWELWLRIEQYYETLSEWYKDKDLYHLIGYLITVEEDTVLLRELLGEAYTLSKREFRENLSKRITKSLQLESVDDIDSLFCNNTSKENKTIMRLLTLFNVETLRTNNQTNERYPFAEHKAKEWTLEHIHAQNSENFEKSKAEPWRVWLRIHKGLMLDFKAKELNTCDGALEELIGEIEAVNDETLDWNTFERLYNKISRFFSEELDDDEWLHSVSNLALLSKEENSALNNSVFEEKRRRIIRMDKNGESIPVCTRNVFLKYYTEDASNSQPYFWGQSDRAAYIKAMKNSLKKYFIADSKEENNG